ncbi:unnamed protein product, partial [Scytosiphon promiscuus]
MTTGISCACDDGAGAEDERDESICGESAPLCAEQPSVDLEASGAHTPPSLDKLHTLAPSYEASSTLEGGAENMRYNTKAAGSLFYPFRTKEQVLIWVWQHTHQISQ